MWFQHVTNKWKNAEVPQIHDSFAVQGSTKMMCNAWHWSGAFDGSGGVAPANSGHQVQGSGSWQGAIHFGFPYYTVNQTLLMFAESPVYGTPVFQFRTNPLFEQPKSMTLLGLPKETLMPGPMPFVPSLVCSC